MKVTLPKVPFDIPAATVDETAPRMPPIRFGKVEKIDPDLVEPDTSNEPQLDVTEQECVPLGKRGEHA